MISLVHGAHYAVNALLEHPGVDAISFVGSAATARHVASTGAAHGKRVQALGGAKNSMVVMPDADPTLMTTGICSSAFGAGGSAAWQARSPSWSETASSRTARWT